MSGATLSRRDFLRLTGASVGLMALAGCGVSGKTGPPAPKVLRFHSRPDLVVPAVRTARSGQVSPGYIFATVGTPNLTAGPVILDNSGQPIWFGPVPGKAVAAFKVQEYQGHPVLTWWEGAIHQPGYGTGECVMADTSYKVLKRIQAGHGLVADLHEFQITPQETALITAYSEVDADLSPMKGPSKGKVLEGILQEIDLATDAVLFEWHSLPQVALEESYAAVPQTGPFDYFHINSAGLDADGNLIISARNTWAVYKVDRRSGQVIWRLGGKKSSFRMGHGTGFEWQHDARRQQDGTITLFDNGAAPKKEPRSRGLVLRVDEPAGSASLVRQYTDDDILASSQGNVQVLPDGNVFVGWGSEPHLTEFDQKGGIVFRAAFLTANQSYRAFRQQWNGAPTGEPAIAVGHSKAGRVAYASWNGATQVSRWQLLGGSTAGSLAPLAEVPRSGFETAIPFSTGPAYLAVRALGPAGQVLGSSAPTRAS